VRALEELIHDTSARAGFGPNGRIRIRDLWRSCGLDSKIRQRSEDVTEGFHLEGDVLDSGLAPLAQPLLAHLRVKDLDQLDLRRTAAKETRLEVVAMNLSHGLQTETLLDEGCSPVEAGYDDADVVDSFELHIDHVRVAGRKRPR
jgi:hypothetical protein